VIHAAQLQTLQRARDQILDHVTRQIRVVMYTGWRGVEGEGLMG